MKYVIIVVLGTGLGCVLNSMGAHSVIWGGACALFGMVATAWVVREKFK